MILVDTSVWIDHLRGIPDVRRQLAAFLRDDQVLCHDFVRGELAMGSFADRAGVLSDLALLPTAPAIPHDEVMEMVSRRKLHGVGIGWVDAHLLAAALVSGAGLWTQDRWLRAGARGAGVLWNPT